MTAEPRPAAMLPGHTYAFVGRWASLPLPHAADELATVAGLDLPRLRELPAGAVMLPATLWPHVTRAGAAIRDAQGMVPEGNGALEAALSHLAAWLDELGDALAQANANARIRIV